MIQRSTPPKASGESVGQRSSNSEAGVALLAALVFIATTTILVAEFTTTTNIDSLTAANARDSVRAHFLNRSGANLGLLLVKIQTNIIDKYSDQYPMLAGQQIGDYTSQIMGVFGGSQEELNDRAKGAGAFGSDMLETLGTSPGGSFDVTLSSEDGKINMNCANGTQAERDNIQNQLAALFFPEAYNQVFEQESADGWRRDRLDQAAALMDYVDRDQGKATNPGNPEDYGYEALDDPYRAKNNLLDSVEELKLVRGVDERFWTLFGSHFTIYGGCKVNLSAVSDPKLISALIILAAKDTNDPVIRDPKRLWALAKQVADSAGFGAVYNATKDFAELVQNPNGMLPGLLPGSTAALEQDALANQVQVQGVELDQTKLDAIATVGPRRIYRLEVESAIHRSQVLGDIRRRLTVIYDTQSTNQNSRNPNLGNGSIVYWREE